MKNDSENFVQYGVYWTDLDPTQGAEMNKTRPCVVVSPREMNMHLLTVLVAPVTSRQRESYPTRVPFSIGDVSGWIVLDQLRAIDRKRLRRKIGCLDGETALLVKNVIREMLVD